MRNGKIKRVNVIRYNYRKQEDGSAKKQGEQILAEFSSISKARAFIEDFLDMVYQTDQNLCVIYNKSTGLPDNPSIIMNGGKEGGVLSYTFTLWKNGKFFSEEKDKEPLFTLFIEPERD